VSEDFRFATIQISGAGERNLLNPGVMSALEQQLSAAAADPEVAGIILTGSGGVFCGGLDTAAFKQGASPVEFAQALVSLLKLIPTLPKPVVAVVDGDAVASGASLVAAADYAVAAPDVKVGTFEVSIGIWPMVAMVPLIDRLGARAAMENIGSGEPFTAERARELGLVNVVAPAQSLVAEAESWLAKAARARGVYAAGRPAVYRLAALPYEQSLDTALTLFTQQFEENK